MTKRKEHPQTDDYPVSLPAAQPPRRAPNQAMLLTLILLAIAAFWLGERLHKPRPVTRHLNLGPVVTARFFQMGQGCLLLLTSPNGKSVLIDAGSTLTEESELSAALKNAHVTCLTAVILTTCRPEAIGGLPRLLAVIPVRGPVLIPVPLDQFLARGGRAAELCRDAIARRGLSVYPCQDFLENHAGLLGENTSLTSRIIPGDPASSDVVRLQYGHTVLVTLANLSPSEEDGALALRGYLSCDVLALPPGNQDHGVSHELLADTSAEDLIVPPIQRAGSGSQTQSVLAASGARLLIMDQTIPLTAEITSQTDDLVVMRPDTLGAIGKAGPELGPLYPSSMRRSKSTNSPTSGGGST